MENLLDKTNVDLPKLKRFINSVTAKELSSLSEPCYYPKTKKFYFEILNILKITDKDFKSFVKYMYKGTKAEKWNLWKDPGTNILIYVMYLFLKNKDEKAFFSTLIYYHIVQYSRLMFKQIRYCYPDTFKYTLDTLTRTHLFFREKGIPNSLFYLSNELQKKYKTDILNWNIEKIILFISVVRHRISQSVKSFAESYYRNRKEGEAIKTQEEESEDNENIYQYKVLKRGQKIIDEVSKKITTYKIIDRKAFNEAKQLSKVKTSIATIISDKLTSDKNYDNIKIALTLFVKNLENVSMICGNDYYIYIKKLMSIRRTSAQLYFKSQINILLIDILKEAGFINSYKQYASQTQFIINLFLAYYLTLILRNTLC